MRGKERDLDGEPRLRPRDDLGGLTLNRQRA
jgi:hypothetical protein